MVGPGSGQHVVGTLILAVTGAQGDTICVGLVKVFKLLSLRSEGSLQSQKVSDSPSRDSSPDQGI